jgi:hypothetical protein
MQLLLLLVLALIFVPLPFPVIVTPCFHPPEQSLAAGWRGAVRAHRPIIVAPAPSPRCPCPCKQDRLNSLNHLLNSA